MDNRWGEGPPGAADPLDQVVHLSNLVGMETLLVQPGGGNSSVKVRIADGSGTEREHLLVKGSGTDLRTIGRAGFTELSMTSLADLRERGDMSDEQMMRFMADCMTDPEQPLPSVETPLHSILPYPVIVHTHDVVTMSITNLADHVAERLVHEVFAGQIYNVPYFRPGFPLARSVLELAPRIPDTAIGLTLAHHGLCIWGADAKTCYERLLAVTGQAEDYLATARRGRRVLGALRAQKQAAARRRALAALLMPVIRGALSRPDRVVLAFDDADEVLECIGSERFAEVSRRGMVTPEHILRAGRLPVVLDLDLALGDDALVASARAGMRRARDDYDAYHARHAGADDAPIDDWAKIVLIPGLGMVSAFKDRKSARTAATCYRAAMISIQNAEALGGFEFIPESQVFEFEHWPLERRKVDESTARERKTLLVPRHVVVVIGAGSGIGEAAAHAFAAEGANVAVADLDAGRAEQVAGEICTAFGDRAIGVAVDAVDDASIQALFEHAILAYGGLDCLFYTAGAAPRFARIEDIERADLQRMLDVHYLGALMAMREAGRIFKRQGCGGSVICSVSKAALAPGKEAVAYGASKAALMQAVRVAALELGEFGVRVNAINADQVDTPLFRRFVEERAAQRGTTFDEQVAVYRGRNALGVSMIPAGAVGELAVLLASERFRYTTGDILTIDGGLPDAFPR